MNDTVIFLGFNDPRKYKRGVENVISIQMRGLPREVRKLYIYFDACPSISRWGNAISIGLKAGPLRFLMLNVLVRALRMRFSRKNQRLILHSHNYLMSALLWWRTDIFSVHDGLWYLKKAFGTSTPWVFWLIERWVYARSRILHCNSNFTYRASLLPACGKPASVIYCSTPLEDLKGNAEVEPMQFTPSDEILVLSVRSIEARARIDLILKVAELAVQKELRLYFVIAGKGPLLEHYRYEIVRRKLQNMKLTGYLSDQELARAYAACDIVLMLCEYGEGFGIPVIEGYLFGKNVVASNRCAVPEILVRPEDLVANDAETILSRLIACLRNPVGAAELSCYYKERFSSQVIARKFGELYQTAFGREGP